MERDVAFDLLHELVDVAVENGHRPEALEIAERDGCIVRAPSPIRIDRPQRDMREDDDRRRGLAAVEVVLQPFELIGAEIAEAELLQVHHVVEADEVHAVVIEAVPAAALGAFAVAFEIGFPGRLVGDVVFAGNVVHVETPVPPMIWFAASNSAGLALCVMSPVCSMNAGFDGSASIRPIASFSVSMRVRIGGLVEADMTVGNLQERETARRRCGRLGPSSNESDFGTPPATVQRTPVPAQIMHSSACRRFTLGPLALSSMRVPFSEAVTSSFEG